VARSDVAIDAGTLLRCEADHAGRSRFPRLFPREQRYAPVT